MIRPFCILLALLISGPSVAGDWPQFRGPSLDGRTSADLGSQIALEPAWSHALGPAYSAVSVADGKAVTLFSDGKKDVAVAFDAVTGRQLWRTAFADTYRGHDGSTDGPVGTPTVDGERVYFVGPFGELVALDLDDGKTLWSKHLADDYGAPKPIYGYSATPVVFDDLLVVQAGGPDGRSVVALDRAGGQQRWASAYDWITHQNPVTTKVGSERVLLSVGALKITAIRPQSGEVLWSHNHSDKPGFDPTYPQPLVLDDQRILLTFDSEAVLYGFGAEGLNEIWRSKALKKNTATPVSHGDYLYGFNGRFLTCVDARNGETVWKSRQPGGRGVILVDGRLIILGSSGRLTLVQATPEGYREEAHLEALAQSAYTAPSFAHDMIFVRNLTHIAAVHVREASSPTAPETVTTARAGGKLATWLQHVRDLPTEQAKHQAVDDFMTQTPSFPIIEDGFVHFIYRGPAQAVAVVGQMLADQEVPEPLERLPGTDLFYRSMAIESDGRWHYRFLVDFDEPSPDPLNPVRALGEPEPTSEITMPGFQDPDHVAPVPLGHGGKLETVSIDSEAYGRALKVRVYLPAAYDSQTPLPLLIMPNGDQWMEARLKNTLDHLFGTVARPAIVALVPMTSWVGGQWGERAADLLGRDLPAALDEEYRLQTTDGSAFLWTVQEKAAIALDLLRENSRFGGAALQSPRTYRPRLEPLSDAKRRGLRAFISWSRYESRSAEKGFDELRAAKDLSTWLKSQGVDVQSGELVPGPGYRTWRRQAEDILSYLLPLAGSP